MSEGFDVNVYEATTAAEAEMVHQALGDAGIEAIIDAMPSPLDGLQTINQGTSVLVRPTDAQRAATVVSDWMAENRYHDEEE